jgi:thymidine kinase
MPNMHTESWYGKLEVVCGPMYGRKTTTLLQRAYWCKDHLQRSIVVLKPAMDNRYSDKEIVSHDGVRIAATPISSWPEIDDSVQHVFVDEAQFFIAPEFKGDLVAEIRTLLKRGIDVLACGLDMDWRGKPFRVTSELLAMADTITKVTAICKVCGGAASKNFKLVPNELTVEVGAANLYEARCNRHWHAWDDELQDAA